MTLIIRIFHLQNQLQQEKQYTSGQGRTGHDRTEQDRTEQDKTVWVKAGQSKT